MTQGLLPWSPCTFPGPTSLFLQPATTFKPKFPRPNGTSLTVTLNSVDERPLTARDRRQMKKEKRESEPTYNWREEVEDGFLKKPKKRYDSWTEELNLDNLALLGPQWCVVRVSRASGQDTAGRMARSMARNFPSLDFKKRQINKPRPAEADDVEAIFEQAKAEQEKADQAFEEQQQTEGTPDSEIVKVMSPLVSKEDAQSNTTTNARGRGKKAAKQPMVGKATPLKPGSTVQVASGSFAGFSGTFKKIDESGLVYPMAVITYWQPLDIHCSGRKRWQISVQVKLFWRQLDE